MSTTNVMIVDDTPERATMLETALNEHGYTVCCRLSSAQGLMKQVEVHQPDIIVIDLDSPDRDMLEHMSVLSQFNPKPVVMFAEEGDSSSIQQAIRAGVSAYIVDGFSPQRVKPILDVAIARFDEFHALRSELEDTRNKLADRKIIDRAKGLLIKSRGLTEEQSYSAMRKLAMDQSKPIVEIAKNIISVMEILDK